MRLSGENFVGLTFTLEKNCFTRVMLGCKFCFGLCCFFMFWVEDLKNNDERGERERAGVCVGVRTESSKQRETFLNLPSQNNERTTHLCL